jgi:hypothetical protein
MPRILRLLVLSAVLVLAVLALAACAPQPTPAPPVTPTETPAPTQVSLDQVPNLSLTVNAPAVGTLIPGERDVFAAESDRFFYDQIALIRTDPELLSTLTITLNGDGTGTRTDSIEGSTPTAFTAPPEALAEIESLLIRMGYFGMEGTFEGPNPTGYSYVLTVTAAEGIRQVTAQDGYTPPDLARMLAVLSELGQAQDATPTPQGAG